MTVAIWRPGFVVLGADRLGRSFADQLPDEDRYTEVTKVGVHAYLSLGWANRGLATLGGGELTEVVRQAIDLVPPSLWAQKHLGTRMVAETLRPMIAARRQEIPKHLDDHARVEVAIAIGHGATARLELIVDDLEVVGLQGGMVHPPHTLDAFFSEGIYATDEGRIGPADEGPEETIQRVTALLEAGIQREAEVSADDLHIGLGGDVVLVTPAAATIANHFKIPAQSE